MTSGVDVTFIIPACPVTGPLCVILTVRSSFIKRVLLEDFSLNPSDQPWWC